MDAPLRVHWVRHGKVASHRGDMPVTSEGLQQVEAAGKQFYNEIAAGEVISLLHTPTRRTRETAHRLYNTMVALRDEEQQSHSNPRFTVLAPVEHRAIRNPDIYVAGIRIEMVSTPEALAEQFPPAGPVPSLQELAAHPFLSGFWHDLDRIGYWVNHPNPPGEDAGAVARRLFTFAASLTDLPGEAPRRYICVTHSPLIRAFIRRYITGSDPGEPNYVEATEMLFSPDGTLTLRYRDTVRRMQWRAG